MNSLNQAIKGQNNSDFYISIKSKYKSLSQCTDLRSSVCTIDLGLCIYINSQYAYINAYIFFVACVQHLLEILRHAVFSAIVPVRIYLNTKSSSVSDDTPVRGMPKNRM